MRLFWPNENEMYLVPLTDTGHVIHLQMLKALRR